MKFEKRLLVHIAEEPRVTKELEKIVRGLNMQVNTPPRLTKKWVLRAVEDVDTHIAIVPHALEGELISSEFIAEIRGRLVDASGIVCINTHTPETFQMPSANLIFSYDALHEQNIRIHLEQFQHHILQQLD